MKGYIRLDHDSYSKGRCHEALTDETEHTQGHQIAHGCPRGKAEGSQTQRDYKSRKRSNHSIPRGYHKDINILRETKDNLILHLLIK